MAAQWLNTARMPGEIALAGRPEAPSPRSNGPIEPGGRFRVLFLALIAAGWKIGDDGLGDFTVKRLKVTNNRDKQDSALVEIKLWKGTEVLALTDCTTEPIAQSTKVTLSCSGADKLPKKFDKLTMNDTF